MTAERREHIWKETPEVDSVVCQLCGIIVSNTALATGIAVLTEHGYVVADGAVMLPDCVDTDLDQEFAELLADG